MTYTFVPDTGGISIDNLGIISGLVIGSNYTVTATSGGCVSASSNTFSFSDQLPSLSLTTSVNDNSICDSNTNCVPTGANVVINEVMHWPNGSQGLIGTGREYIELYNPTCNSIDISCFILGTRSAPDSNPTGSLQTGGSIIIPSGTILAPKSHYVIGTSSSSSDPDNIDLKLDLILTNNCVSGNFVLPNGDGWLALYDANGQPIDGLYWTVSANQSSKITTDDDFNDRPCVPNSVGICDTSSIILLAPNEIFNLNLSLMNYVGITTPNPLSPTHLTFSRIPDGASWQSEQSGTISGTNCNSVCDSVPTLVCNGSATVNVDSGSGNYSYVWSSSANNQITQTATELCSGIHSVTVTDNVTNCQSTISVTINTILPPPPSIGEITQPTCFESTGSFQINDFDSSNTYLFTPNVVSISSTGLVIANSGNYSFTVTNASGCTSVASANIIVNTQPDLPSPPTIGEITQPTCFESTGSFQINDYDASNTYLFIPNVVSISSTGLVTVNSGNYSFTVTNASGCTSLASANIIVNIQPDLPSPPTIGEISQPTCFESTGNFQINDYDASNTYLFTPNVVSISSTGLVTANSGNYSFTVTNASGCTSLASANIILNVAPPSPIVTLSSGCNDLNYEIVASTSSSLATYEWYNGATLIGSAATVIVSSVGTYQVDVTVDGCTTTEFITIDNVFCSIPKGLSPNGDGLNDTWDLSNLNVREVKIFNRYGLEVYQQNNYTNQWGGRDMKGNELPTATYYYVITFESGKQKTGWVYLQRVK